MPDDADKCSATAVALGTPTTADNCAVASVTAARNDGKPLTYPYPLGDTLVTWTVSDTSANTATCTQTVTVKDHQKPTIFFPANLSDPTAAPYTCSTPSRSLGTPTTADN